MMTLLYVVFGGIGAIALLALGRWRGLGEFEQRMQLQLLQLNKDLASTRAAQELVPDVRCHTILLDGVSHGGKTTFMARLACPTADTEQLTNVATTRRQQLTREIPLCWERVTEEGDSPVLHALRFFDVSGENPSTVVNAVKQLTLENEEDQRVVALWVWDLSNLDANRSRMTREVINALYGHDEARALIQKIVVFFNKVDLLAEKKGAESVGGVLAQEEAYIRDVLDRGLGGGYQIEFRSGSAMDGRGMLDVYGALLRALELGKNYHALHAETPPPPVAQRAPSNAAVNAPAP